MDDKDDEYHSASDLDFDPDAPDSEVGSSSEDEANGPKGLKRKVDDEQLDFDNSGDEATLTKARRKKQKKGSVRSKDRDEDDEAEGGLIKTRAQRQAETKEKKPLVQATAPTVDIDSIWTQMSTASNARPAAPAEQASNDPVAQPSTASEKPSCNSNLVDALHSTASGPERLAKEAEDENANAHRNGEPMITIKRSYEFAGEKVVEERMVPASSAEARLYLEAQEREKDQASQTPKQPSVKRPMKRKSMFAFGAASPQNEQTASGKGHKLNTLEKSKLDWASHVDKEGIAEELDEHRKAKDTYLGRIDFLGRMDTKREEEIRNTRSK